MAFVGAEKFSETYITLHYRVMLRYKLTNEYGVIWYFNWFSLHYIYYSSKHFTIMQK